VKPFKPSADLEQRSAQVKRESENRDQFKAECERWKGLKPEQTVRIVNALIRALDSAPTPEVTETMKQFRARSEEWAKGVREPALRWARGER
jgi:catalase